MSDIDDERFAERMLRDLTGGILDMERLEADSEAISDFARVQNRLWALPIQATSPAPAFSASWDWVSVELSLAE